MNSEGSWRDDPFTRETYGRGRVRFSNVGENYGYPDEPAHRREYFEEESEDRYISPRGRWSREPRQLRQNSGRRESPFSPEFGGEPRRSVPSFARHWDEARYLQQQEWHPQEQWLPQAQPWVGPQYRGVPYPAPDFHVGPVYGVRGHAGEIPGVSPYWSYGAPGFGYPGRAGHNFRGRGPKGYQRSDQRIHEDICDRLADDPEIDATEIEVRVEGGDVILEGRVRDRLTKHHIEDISERVSGVKDVRNHLRVLKETSFETTDPDPRGLGTQKKNKEHTPSRVSVG